MAALTLGHFGTRGRSNCAANAFPLPSIFSGRGRGSRCSGSQNRNGKSRSATVKKRTEKRSKILHQPSRRQRHVFGTGAYIHIVCLLYLHTDAPLTGYITRLTFPNGPREYTPNTGIDENRTGAYRKRPFFRMKFILT